MKKINGYEDVKASGENKQLPAGGYIAMITNVEDIPDKEYLKISFDIATGEYAHYFGEMEERLGWHNGIFLQIIQGKCSWNVQTVHKRYPGVQRWLFMEYKVIVKTKENRSYVNEAGETINYSPENEVTFTFSDIESASCFADTASKHLENFESVYIYFAIEEF